MILSRLVRLKAALFSAALASLASAPASAQTTTLYNRTSSDGSEQLCALAFNSTGQMFGTTSTGVVNGLGTLFRCNLDGTGFQVLRNFSNTDGNGYYSIGGVMLASDGRLYGTCYTDTTGFGTLYAI